MTKDEALSKIRKLLATNGRTEHEIDTAQILAAALAQQHDIDLAEIDLAEERRQSVITHRCLGEWSKLPVDADYAALICKRYFEVTTFTERGWTDRLICVGTERHIEVAEYVFKFLLHEFRWQWKHKRGRCRDRKNFLYGCFVALSNKLNERFARPAQGNSVELSWRAKRDQYIKETFGELTKHEINKKVKRNSAALRGFEAGQDIEIRPGVNGGSQRPTPSLGFESRLLTNG